MDRVSFIESLGRTRSVLSSIACLFSPFLDFRLEYDRELTVKTGDGDLGGFLRLRLGHLLPQHEKKEEGEDDDDDDGDAPEAASTVPDIEKKGEEKERDAPVARV